MNYTKYVRQLEFFDSTSEPTEFIPAVQQEDKLTNSNQDEIIYLVVFSGVFFVFVVFSLLYLKRYRDIC